jgi:hypothetical protein
MSQSSRRRLSESTNRPRIGLLERFEERRPEIEETILTRVYSICDSTNGENPEYVQSLRATVSAGLRYWLSAAQGDSALSEPIPSQLLVQARLAARNGVGLEIVMRRYFASYTLLYEFILTEAEAGDLVGAEEIRRLSQTQGELFNRVIEAVAAEHRSEAEVRLCPRNQRRTEYVIKLLTGELADSSGLEYDLRGWHLGVIATGAESDETIRQLATGLDRRPLAISRGEETLWAWFGGQRRIEPEEIEQLAAAELPTSGCLAIGEPGSGIVGWRLTHRQAAAALPIALRSPEIPIRYATVALLASILQDEVLTKSLDDLFLAPLTRERDGGRTLRETLRAYFKAERNASSSAAALGVNRHTVTKRIHEIEERIGRPLGDCSVEIEVALRLEGLGRDKSTSSQGGNYWNFA